MVSIMGNFAGASLNPFPACVVRAWFYSERISDPYFGVWIPLLLLGAAVRSDADDKYATLYVERGIYRDASGPLTAQAAHSDYGVSVRRSVSCGLSERA
jgi:hypothetical protein